ncbi:solute carrier family 13 member 5-like isoform X1 [Pomacea canaliculata]|uniref:solute carrier family 13 member 5-like isoform X1 n=1 Tax=Pomacea canaliculata TaxID=400727 RepID=UPI000D731805|nr:solute carrier family 13 member 5-like isoform X1 [Pomacea canaliculata]XP_025091971.1 solute carrier family 13 member 5-like isoform X1 [Pomacea canaliculata]XP_025091972.1 solute carrier family 13 member 5-like isoform X1 [Pomacea canaliculata]XP_025091973.1 solute carrier family 13 member 5-like isoform X1 [Pomacea canaliculata]
MRRCLRSFWESRTLWLSVLIPIAVLPLPLLYPNSIARCGYCVIVTGIFWVTELLPLPVTSLFPLFLFPMLGVMKASDVCSSYVKDTLMLFMGSLVVAVAVEKWNLHRRLALRTLTLVGPQPRWLLMGIMFPCFFLSMWMSNTATTAMMMPIVTAILHQIRQSRKTSSEDDELTEQNQNDIKLTIKEVKNGKIEDDEVKTIMPNRASDEDKEFASLAKTFSLCTAFSANIGGVATLTGTPPNVIFKGLADVLYQQYGETNPINFANWLILGVPLAVICFIFLWFWFQLYAQGLKCFQCFKKGDESYSAVKRILQTEYRKLGPMSFAEIIVLVDFIVLAILWVTRNPGFIPGWSSLFEKEYVKDSTPAILLAVVLFFLPARPPRWLPCCRSKSEAIMLEDGEKHPLLRARQRQEALEFPSGYQPILTWKLVNERLAWGVLLLMGGGFALADGCQVSGLSKWVSGHLAALATLDPWVIGMLLTLFIAVTTEVTSNAATTTLFVPIVGDLAVQLGVNPLYFMIPCTISASLAFLLPVATPPNAIVFSTGFLKVKDMVLVGLPINIFALVALNIACNTWAASTYDLFNVPLGFRINSTAMNLNDTMVYSINSSLPLNVSVIS